MTFSIIGVGGSASTLARSADQVWRHVADQLRTKFENKPPKRPESLYCQ